jgi:hypothetical protein
MGKRLASGPSIHRFKVASECCFCGEVIAPVRPDPVVLSLQVEDGGTQALPVHLRCLQRALRPGFPLAPFNGEK